MMKNIVLIFLMFSLLFSMLIGGCAYAQYNPETKEARYWRLGDQRFGGFTAVFPDGSVVTFEQQKSDAKMLELAIKLIETGADIRGIK